MRSRRSPRRDPTAAAGERRVVVVVSVGGVRELEHVVRRMREAAEPTHIVVCCDDLAAFDAAFDAGVDAWVSARADERTIRSATGL